MLRVGTDVQQGHLFLCSYDHVALETKYQLFLQNEQINELDVALQIKNQQKSNEWSIRCLENSTFLRSDAGP